MYREGERASEKHLMLPQELVQPLSSWLLSPRTDAGAVVPIHLFVTATGMPSPRYTLTELVEHWREISLALSGAPAQVELLEATEKEIHFARSVEGVHSEVLWAIRPTYKRLFVRDEIRCRLLREHSCALEIFSGLSSMVRQLNAPLLPAREPQPSISPELSLHRVGGSYGETPRSVDLTRAISSEPLLSTFIATVESPDSLFGSTGRGD